MLITGLTLIFFSIACAVYYRMALRGEKIILLPAGQKGFLKPLIKGLARLNERIKGEKIERIRENLKIRLGRTGEALSHTPDEFFALQELSGIVFCLCGAIIAGSFRIGTLIVLFPFGFLFPLIVLRDRIRKREKSFMKSLPYALDLLTLSVEAGLDFTAAIGKIVEKSKEGPLSGEFSNFLGELRIGKTRREALRDMAKRVGISDFSSFTSALIQADELGTSLGPVLRVQSDELRKRRILSAEKSAMEVPVKILLPLIAFIFPAVFFIVFGPIILTGIF